MNLVPFGWLILVWSLASTSLKAVEFLVEIIEDPDSDRPKVILCEFQSVEVPEDPNQPTVLKVLTPDGRRITREIPRLNGKMFKNVSAMFVKRYSNPFALYQIVGRDTAQAKGHVGRVTAIRWDPFDESFDWQFKAEVTTHVDGKEKKVVLDPSDVRPLKHEHRQRYGTYDRAGKLIVVYPISKGNEPKPYFTTVDIKDVLNSNPTTAINRDPPRPRRIAVEDLIVLDKSEGANLIAENTKRIMFGERFDYGEVAAPSEFEEPFEGRKIDPILGKVRERVKRSPSIMSGAAVETLAALWRSFAEVCLRAVRMAHH